MPQIKNNLKLTSPILWVFIISIIYWIFLFFSSEMHIVFDSIGYEASGNRIYAKGWLYHMSSGIKREPLYLILISLSMHLGDIFSVSYQIVQKVFQILIMFISQIMIWRILVKLKIHHYITAVILLYWGLSPAINNSAFSLFSEIITYPFVLLILLISIDGYHAIKNSSFLKTGFYGLLLGICFILLTFVKALFGYILVFYLIPFVVIGIHSLYKKQFLTLGRSLTFVVMTILAFNALMIPYKLMNKKYNGEYTFTNRGPWLLYGNTMKRLQEIHTKDIAALIAFTAGDKLCYKNFEKSQCDIWHLDVVERLGSTQRQKLSQSFDKPEVDSLLIHTSVKEILKQPLQYTFVTAIETFKLFFWESTQIGCVNYVAWQRKIFANPLVKNGIRLFAFLLTVISFFGIIIHLCRKRNWDEDKTPIIFLTIWMIISFIALHSFFFVVTRYIFSIVPLYLICWGIFLNTFTKKSI